MSTPYVSSDIPTTAEGLLQLLQLAKLAETFPDYPKNFTPPSHTDPNYVAPEIGDRIIIVAMTTISVAILLVALRLWVRLSWTGITFGLDDWFLIPGIILSTVLAVLQVVMVKSGGLGKHIYDNNFGKLELTLKLVYVHIMVYYLALTLIKTSILLFIYRLTTSQAKAFRRIIIGFIVFLWLYMVVCCFVSTFGCSPARATFDLNVRIQNATCINLPTAMLSVNAILVATDILLVILPVHLVWKLQLPRQKRLGIIALFSIGIFICVSNILKMLSLNAAYNSYDFTWRAVDSLIWAQVEGAVAIMAATLPSLNALFLALIPKGFGLATNTKSWSRSNAGVNSGSPQDEKMPADVTYDSYTRGPETESRSEASTYEMSRDSSIPQYVTVRKEIKTQTDSAARAAAETLPRKGSVPVTAGQKRYRPTSTLDKSLRNIWLETPALSIMGDSIGETRSEGGSDNMLEQWADLPERKNSWQGRRARNFSVPAPRLAANGRKTTTANSRLDGYIPQQSKSAARPSSLSESLASSQPERSPRAEDAKRDGHSVWNLSRALNVGGRKKPVNTGITKTSEFTIQVNDPSTQKGRMIPEDYWQADQAYYSEEEAGTHSRPGGVRRSWISAGGEDSDDDRTHAPVQGITKTSEFKVTHGSLRTEDGLTGFDFAEGNVLRANETLVEGGPSKVEEPRAAPMEGIRKWSEVRVEYSRSPDMPSDGNNDDDETEPFPDMHY